MEHCLAHCLVTGGLGFIGSHTVVQLLESGYIVTIIDNLCNSNKECLNRIKMLCPNSAQNVAFYNIDLLDKNYLEQVIRGIQLTNDPITSCIHFAGLKAVGESIDKPLLYYNNNITGTLNLLEIMARHNINKIVFSSSATVYGQNKDLHEKAIVGVGITNPYGKTKYMIEEILKDYCLSNDLLKCIVLRYFNPVGAHPSGNIGEDPLGIPNNLMPYICQVAIGKLEKLCIYGNDYDTPDGTCIRDYIHVMDLARAHLLALNNLNKMNTNYDVFNVGSGNGYSVLEVYNAMNKVVCGDIGKDIPYKITDRRNGDLPKTVAIITKAKEILGFECQHGIEEICRDAWKWSVNSANL